MMMMPGTQGRIALPLDSGRIHFTGIGGIGMSGIAEILNEMGYTVQGSDAVESAHTARLAAKGIAITIGQKAENVAEASLVVISTAIADDNPEVMEALRRGLPVIHRAEMLGELMRLRTAIAIAGTHGKTTTTSLAATLLDAAGLEPTVINGGIIGHWGSNARLGSGDWMVAEADESDGSFAHLSPAVAVVTNIDAEHLDHYGNFNALEAAFADFIAAIPFNGFAVLCADHPVLREMAAAIHDRRIITYAIENDADLRGVNIRNDGGDMLFDVALSERMRPGGRENGTLHDLRLPMPGNHNVLNCLAAVSVAVEIGIDADAIARGLKQFTGVGRRFETKGSVGGITVIDDYGHHPVEIKAALAAARMLVSGRGTDDNNKIIAVVQPHRYTRLRNLFDDFCTCFGDADCVLVADVYPAGEEPLPGFDRDALVAGLQRAGHGGAEALASPDALPQRVLEIARTGDVVICLGAGSSTHWAAALPEHMRALLNQRRQA